MSRRNDRRKRNGPERSTSATGGQEKQSDQRKSDKSESYIGIAGNESLRDEAAPVCAGCEAPDIDAGPHAMLQAEPPWGGARLCVRCACRLHLDARFETDVLNAIACGTTWPHVQRAFAGLGAEPPRSAEQMHALLGAMFANIELMARLTGGRP